MKNVEDQITKLLSDRAARGCEISYLYQDQKLIGEVLQPSLDTLQQMQLQLAAMQSIDTTSASDSHSSSRSS